MFIKRNNCTALVSSAVFLYSSFSLAQAPVIDASVDSTYAAPAANTASPVVNNESPTADTAPAGAPAMGSANTRGELFYQLQLLQQEVMQLRGVVEQQAHTLKQMKEQNTERYIDLDRRIGALMTNPQAVNTASAAVPADDSQQVVALEGEKSRYNAAYKLVVNKHFNEALDAFKQFLVDFPDGKYAPNSFYWLGELYQVITPPDLEASRQAFTQLLDQYPTHAKVPDAMYKLGKVYFQKGNKEKSRQWLERVIAEHGNGVNAAANKARQFLDSRF